MTDRIPIKEELLKFCWNHINERAERFRKRSVTLQESLNSESKSSAGDKHETGRAMVQLEQEKLGKQLLELEKTKMVLQKVDVAKQGEKIRLGSLVKTSSAYYFIAISAGVFKAGNTSIFCISANSPVARLLLGKEEGNSYTFNGKQERTLEIA
ncbi:MAG: 3-oxoacyl-ACP synthase [Flavobacteriaceae bacterium]